MKGKSAMKSVVVTLLVIAVLKISPVIGQEMVCPWCNNIMQSKLVNCLYVGMVTAPELDLPIPCIDDLKWKLVSDSDSMSGLPYDIKKVKMDDDLGTVMANFIQQYFPNNHLIRDLLSQLAGKCYSSVTGYDQDLVTRQIVAKVTDEITKSSVPPARSPDPMPDSAYPADQPNFPPPSPPIQPPVNPPNSFPSQEKPTMDNDRYGNNPAVQANKPIENGPFNSPGTAPINNAPYNSPAQPQVNSYNNPLTLNKDAGLFQNQPSNFNPSNGNEGQGQAGQESLRNRAPNGGSSGTSNQNNNEPQSNRNSPNTANSSRNRGPGGGSSGTSNQNNNEPRGNRNSPNTANSGNQAPTVGSTDTFNQNNKDPQDNKNSPNTANSASTASSKTFSQGSKSSNSDSDSSTGTTASPNSNAPEKETTGSGSGKSNDEESCDEKFKAALYDKLIDDDRFDSFCGQPASKTKSAIPGIIKRAFKEYGIEKHYQEFTTLWTFDSKELNRESKVEDYAETITKVIHIVFSRNKIFEECDETGRKIADCILGTLPGNPPTSTTEKPNQNDGSDKITTESNSNSQAEETNSASNSTANASPRDDFNSGKSNVTNPEDLSFAELNSKLSNIFSHDGSSGQDSDQAPFSEMLPIMETQENLHKLLNAAKSCMSPDGFDYERFVSNLKPIADSMQKNHPDWSRDKCEKETYAETVVALAKAVQDKISSNSGSGQSEPSSSQDDSAGTSNNAQNSNSEADSNVPKDYNVYSDDSAYSGPDYYSDDYNPDSVPENAQYPQDYMDYSDSDYSSSYGSQPDGSDDGFRDYEPPLSQPPPQNLPSYDYSANPPAGMDSQPNSGAQPVPMNRNTGLQQPPNYAPDSGIINPPNGNFRNDQSQAKNFGNNYQLNGRPSDPGPMLAKDNFQNSQRYNAPAAPPDHGPMIQRDNIRNSQPNFQPGLNPAYSSPN